MASTPQDPDRFGFLASMRGEFNVVNAIYYYV